jgi:hypothetical protein
LGLGKWICNPASNYDNNINHNYNHNYNYNNNHGCTADDDHHS